MSLPTSMSACVAKLCDCLGMYQNPRDEIITFPPQSRVCFHSCRWDVGQFLFHFLSSLTVGYTAICDNYTSNIWVYGTKSITISICIIQWCCTTNEEYVMIQSVWGWMSTASKYVMISTWLHIWQEEQKPSLCAHQWPRWCCTVAGVDSAKTYQWPHRCHWQKVAVN